ncbi:MAG: DUF1573 domain-containing protein [Flavobacteriia bacterium]|jgi:hypothetical protein|nr:DUF1573 domain-containing protein [Flavobacteriia bacterium]NBV69026.1 DUF1573 domain-containing protein [Flavobacteriia bacterium]NBV91937.1 DUF1573 domain-containing protein [Flavobacteriia bacterium]
MKHLFCLLSFFVIFGLNAQVSTSTKKTNQLKFDKVEIIRNEIPYDSKELFVFTFVNKSGKPLKITNVQTSCGCTTAEKPENAIPNNKKGKISVSYDTKRVGEFVKTITVSSDQTEPVVLTIRGIVLPEKTH